MGCGEQYDELVDFASLPPETEAEVDGLAELADGGRALELGVGTGRVAIPLAGRGVEVHGIELDPSMVERLRTKPGSDRVRVHLGDMADVDVEGCFELIFAVFGTLFALPSQDQQLRCFHNVARHLTSEGRFVVEALVPQPGTYHDGHRISVAHASDERVVINVSALDLVAQTIDTRQVVLASNRPVDIVPIHVRYSWPAELDLMAQTAGLRLFERWANWDRQPFANHDVRHISIYGRADRSETDVRGLA